MQALSIILAFVFLGSLVVLGMFLTGVGVRRLQKLGHAGSINGSRTVYVSLDLFLVAFGLLLTFWGATGTFRVIWGI